MNLSLVSGDSRPLRGDPGFALISVLALVSLAALTATAFLASARLERASTRPLGERVRLEMALNIGMNCAKEIINDGVGSSYDNIATYWRTNRADELGYLLLGTPRFTTGNPALYWYAAFSTARMTELATNAPPTTVMTTRTTVTNQSMFSNVISAFMVGLTNFTNGSTNIELLGHTAASPRLSPPVGWITIRQPVRITPGTTNTASQPTMRFAFFVEDLSGLIDAERMCGNPNRTTGTNSLEISKADLGIPFNTDPANRATYLTPFLLSTNGSVVTTNLRYFATGIRSWTNAIPRIPRCVAVSASKTYGNATNGDGTKVSLNDPANLTVAKIATAISNNLPDFAQRAGGMSAGAYLSNIAANIVDYIDADSTPTVDSGSPPAWRGCEAIAWPNEIFTRIHFESADTQAVPGGFQYSFKYKHYLEVWNINNTSVPLNNLVISNNRSFLVRIPPLTFNLNSAAFGAISNLTMTPVAGSPSTLRPGEFGMLETPTITLRTNISGSTSITNVQFQDWNQNSSVIYTSTGEEISRTKMGSLTYNKDIVATNPYGVGNGVNFSSGLSYAVQRTYRAPPPNLKSIGGDPRAQMFLGTWPTKGQLYVNYSSPGGLNWESGNSGFSNGYVNATSFWPDGGKYNPSDLGANPTSYGISPETYYSGKKGTWSTNVSLTKNNNTGSLTNICELGNIFDPMQWEDSSQLPTAAGGMPGLWTNLSATAVAADTAGGRISLRIGRPEFNRFAFTNLGAASDLPVPNMGQSASALLDIFCAANRYDNGGKINLNTAPGPVLRALAGGISVSSDPAKVGLETNTTMVSAFTNGVMRFRQAYPFYSPSQLAFISTNYAATNNWTNGWNSSAVFSTNSPAGGLAGISVANDQALEEWFSKIYNFASVDSYNFRVYVYAQLVNSNNVPYGRIARKYYHIYAEQTADSAGEIFSGAGYSLIPERESEY